MRYAQIITTLWAIVALLSWTFQDFVRNDLFGGVQELPEVALAGFILGLLGLTHVSRRARRLQSAPMDQSGQL